MAASDVVLLASGTATLEATLIKRPMVVAYRLSPLTSFLLKSLKLFKAPYFAQPNLLAGRQVVLSTSAAKCAPTCSVRRCSRNSNVPIAISSCKLSPRFTRRSAAMQARARRTP
jgi:lipid-A-disaccharide synthase